ncbi:hypothetical protein [Hyphomonas sp.]|uniref:hypothetical protein n=1 Tax=Hyphomonas sp. TaxID=87 RepID=UPI0025C553E9|nr:hypothetical protein [Hyphomonas sp.]MEE2923132.1 hypothetical protein [Pseudomonadota bacterium]
MRSIVLGASLCLLAGCATVSMVPGQASVETSLTQSQSALRKVSAEYCTRAVQNGWVEASGGLAGFASTLINGKSDSNDARDYASRIGAKSDAPSLVLARIVSDAQAARDGLADVSREAEDVLQTGGDGTTSRADVMSYERALVRAQMAYRNFQGALGEVTTRNDMDMDIAPVDRELRSFADTIDQARETADGLADKYASLNSSIS